MKAHSQSAMVMNLEVVYKYVNAIKDRFVCYINCTSKNHKETNNLLHRTNKFVNT